MGLEKLTKNCIPGILCGIVILILTGLPGSVFPKVKPIIGLDKVVHILMYATFAFFCIWGYRQPYREGNDAYRRKAIILTCIISILYGGFTELIQEFLVPSRIGSWFDFLADAIGTLLGISIFRYFFRKGK